MDEKEIQRIWRRAYVIALQYQHLVDPEDYAQRVILYFMEHPKRKGTVSQLIIDFLRSDFGRHDKTHHNLTKRNINAAISHLDLPIENLIQLSDSEKNNPNMTRDLVKKCMSLLTRIEDRIIFQLYYVWGFNHQEIGDLFGRSMSRMSQKLTVIEKGLIEQMGGG